VAATAVYALTQHWSVPIPPLALYGELGAALAIGAIAGLVAGGVLTGDLDPVPHAEAKYTLDPAVAEQCRARCADLLGRHPLYPGIEL
jgi:hypothetical protein